MHGAAVNIIFGLLVYFIIISSFGNNISTTIEGIKEGYAAEFVDIRPGDEIIKIDGVRTRLYSDIVRTVNKVKDTETVLVIKRDDKIREVVITPTKVDTNYIGIYLGAKGQDLSTEIKNVLPGSPAEDKGILAGDIIISVNDVDIGIEPDLIREQISAIPGEDLKIEVERNGKVLEFLLTPELIESYYLGIEFAYAKNSFGSNIYYGFWETMDFTISIGDNLKRLFTGQVNPDQLMGPIGISEVVTKTSGFLDFISLVAIISLSLGITNLLPIPPLDGGKIILVLIEGIRRKPIGQELEIRIQLLGFVFLIALSIYVAYNDILRIF